MIRRVYRVTATYPPAAARQPFRRHFQTKAAAERMAARLRTGYSREGGGIDEYWFDRVPPAQEVKVEPSDPVTWPS